MKKMKVVFMMLLVMSTSIIWATNTKPKGKHTREKTVTIDKVVAPKTLINIINLYGDVDIDTWDEDRVLIEAVITVNGNTLGKVEERLKKIRFEVKLDEKLKKFECIATGFFRVPENCTSHLKVRLPKTAPLKLVNYYGDIIIDETEGSTDLGATHGSIKAGKLLNSENSLAMSYSQDTEIGYMKEGKIYGGFSDYVIHKADYLWLKDLNSSNGVIKEVGALHYYGCNYGSITVDKVKTRILGVGQYLNTKVNECDAEEINIRAKYGSVIFSKWNNTKSYFEISYAKLVLGYSNEKPFDLKLDLKGCIVEKTLQSLPEAFVETKAESEDNFIGYYLQPNSQNKTTIKMRKGIINFKEVRP